MTNKLFAALMFFITAATFAQEGSSSPYSFYGIGEMRFRGTADTRAMGGISVLADSIHYNLQNPALLSRLKLTTFSVGGTFSKNTLKTQSQDAKAQRTVLDYLAVGFPMGKFSAGFGLAPLTSVGYKINRPATDDNPEGRKYSGTGGINKVFAGAAYQFNKNFSIGAEVSYNFGEIETVGLYTISGVQFGSREINRSVASGVAFNTGIAYQGKLNEKLSIYASSNFSPHMVLSFGNERKIATIQFLQLGGQAIIDEDDVPVADTKVSLPAQFAFGAGVGEVKKWMVGSELTLMHNSSLNNRFADMGNSTFENGMRVSIGGYYVPNYNSFTDYFKKVTYRAGLKYEKSGLVINGENINDMAFTVGAGLPLAGTFSNINLGAEIGRRGTTSQGLIQENYANFTVGLSFNDRWFVKRRYD